MINTPLVSILVPVYNVEKYIGRCIDSLFSQTYVNIEFIFVDDCTPDNSISIIKEKLQQYPTRKNFIKIINHPNNLGLTAARKTALLHATGEYIWHVDSDDYITIDAVERLVKKATETQMDMIVFNVKEIYANREKEIIQDCPHSKEEYLYKILTRRSRFELCFRFCKKNLYDYIEFDEEVCHGEDYLTTPRLVYNSNGVAFLNYVCYFYVKNNPTSYTSSITIRSVKSLEKAMNILSIFFLEKDSLYYAPILQLSRAFLKSHLLKSAVYNNEAFKYAFKLYPTLSAFRLPDLPLKNRIIILLSNLKCRILLSVYIKIGLLLKS